MVSNHKDLSKRVSDEPHYSNTNFHRVGFCVWHLVDLFCACTRVCKMFLSSKFINEKALIIYSTDIFFLNYLFNLFGPTGFQKALAEIIVSYMGKTVHCKPVMF